MSAKGGKKGKGKGKGKNKGGASAKLSNVDKTFYELTITDLNQKLSRLRTHLQNLDDSNFNLTEKIRGYDKDRSDVAAHLERSLAEHTDTIRELEERLLETTKIRNNENTTSADTIKDLETKYRAMHDQLSAEIKLLNGKLNSLDEFRVQRDVLLTKFDNQELELRDKDRNHKEDLYMLEQKAVVEKDALKKEVQGKLLEVSADFTRSSEIRNAGYTRRLIRENIALQKEIDILVLSQIRMQKQQNEQIQRHKEMTEQYATLNQLKKQLIRSSQNKTQIIEKLTYSYEKVKGKYVEMLKYRHMYEILSKRDICDHFNFHDATKKMRALGQRIETLKLDKSQLVSMHEQHEAEILRLRAIIEKMKLTVQMAIDVFGHTHDSSGVEEHAAVAELKRHDLLAELIEILSSHSDNLPKTPSVLSISQSNSSLYRPGKMGFLPRQPSSLMDIFEKEARKVASTDAVSSEFQVQEDDSKIIPMQRLGDMHSIIDVELGSILYVSSSHENLEMVEMDEEPVDDEEGSSSSDYRSSGSSASHPPSIIDVTTARSSKSSKPPEHQHVDLQIEQVEPTSQPDVPIKAGDSDADSINLFY